LQTCGLHQARRGGSGTWSVAGLDGPLVRERWVMTRVGDLGWAGFANKRLGVRCREIIRFWSGQGFIAVVSRWSGRKSFSCGDGSAKKITMETGARD